MKSAEQALNEVLNIVREYLPPDGIDAKEAIAQIIALVDPWPLAEPVEPSLDQLGAIAMDGQQAAPIATPPNADALDAARYRWIFSADHFNVDRMLDEAENKQSLDAAIDAAIALQPQSASKDKP